jgi:hypothetical protein
MPMHVEADFEAFLKRVVPGCDEHWRGASEEEIEEIEDFVEEPLPAFYRWFLTRMGRSMGPLDSPHQDTSCKSIIMTYEQGLISPSPHLLLIGIEPDEIMPMHVFYDLRKPARNDARVCSAPADGGYLQIEFETRREAMAWSLLLRTKISRSARQCKGTFSDSSCNIIPKLTPALANQDFTSPIQTGLFCAIFERSDATLIAMAPPHDDRPPHLYFQIGANNEHTIRGLLGSIATDTSLEVKIRKWT